MAIQSESKSRSRRALLAGVLGGVGAWAASVLGRGNVVQATHEGYVQVSHDNFSTDTTRVESTVTHNDGGALRGDATQDSANITFGVAGKNWSSHGRAVWGVAVDTGPTAPAYGVYGETFSPNGVGVYGQAFYGEGGSKGVWGHSPAGHGIHGHSSTGWAGYFDGRVLTKRYQEFVEMKTPSAPPSNHARLFVRDNGSGNTQLCVRFHNGNVRVLATA